MKASTTAREVQAQTKRQTKVESIIGCIVALEGTKLAATRGTNVVATTLNRRSRAFLAGLQHNTTLTVQKRRNSAGTS